MDEKQLCEQMVEIDKILSNITNPPLNRHDHDAIRQIMSLALQRIKLSYELENLPDVEKESKEEQVD
jgi:hypothetical protein